MYNHDDEYTYDHDKCVSWNFPMNKYANAIVRVFVSDSLLKSIVYICL